MHFSPLWDFVIFVVFGVHWLFGIPSQRIIMNTLLYMQMYVGLTSTTIYSLSLPPPW